MPGKLRVQFGHRFGQLRRAAVGDPLQQITSPLRGKRHAGEIALALLQRRRSVR
jgi:hypothetical protein